MNWMELAPNTRPMPTIVVVAVEAAEMQYDSSEMSEISRFGDRFSVHHLFLKRLSTGISEKNEWRLDRWAPHPSCSTPLPFEPRITLAVTKTIGTYVSGSG
jgi:hypothetical protein